MLRTFCFLASALTLPGFAQIAPKSLNAVVERAVASISEERIEAIMKKLSSYPTRDSHSETNVAARQWILEELQSYSPRLQVRFDTHKRAKGGRVVRDLDIVNVIATLPGSSLAQSHVAVGGHYDSWGAVRHGETVDNEATAAAPYAPGADDNASGVAAVMELARVLSQHEFRKTIVFIAFGGEEQGLLGSRGLAKDWKSDRLKLEALLNNDVIGSERSDHAFSSTHAVRVFAEEPMDSVSRSLARYVKEVGERYMPQMNIDLIFRRDRFGRAGDHTPFHAEGFAAVRFTTPAENLSVQHTAADTMERTSPALTARVARVNAATLSTLALAPEPPELKPIQRGKSRHDAELAWYPPSDDEVAGYVIRLRGTTQPFWERDIYTTAANEFTLKGVSIDDKVIGVQAIGKNGAESLVSVFTPRDVSFH